MTSVDDRGNVVDFYSDGEKVATLNREADPLTGFDISDFSYSWDGYDEEMNIAFEHDYQEELGIAIMYNVLRKEPTAEQQMRVYLQLQFDHVPNTDMRDEAIRLIAQGIKIMTPEQVSQWQGVRAWQERYA